MQPSPSNTPRRIHVVDWLRGLAVVLMVMAHGMDAWLLPDAKSGLAYAAIKVGSGIPARLFLLLVGVSAAIQFEAGLSRGTPAPVMRTALAKRGLLVIVLAYVFRAQEWLLSGFYGGVETLFRVDILNAIGASMIVVAMLSTPRRGRRQVVASLAGAAVFLGLGTVVGPAQFPAWLPREITSYIGGQRPMAWFSLFPWGAWALIGVPVGHWWVAANADARTLGRCFGLTFLVGALLLAAVLFVRWIAPFAIRYPSAVVEQMGPGIFFSRLGILGMLAGVGYVACRWRPHGFSVLRQLGRTSLLIYWVHIELCYGRLVYPLRGNLSLAAASLAVAALTVAMLGLSVLKTRYAKRLAEELRQRFRRTRPA